MPFNLVIKVGDQSGPMGIKDGMPVCTLPNHEILSEHMRTVYAVVSLPDSLYGIALQACNPLFVDARPVYPRNKFISLTSLSIALGDPSLEEKWRAEGIIVAVQNGAGLDESIFEAAEDREWPDILDNNTIASGSFTVGSGGDYSNWTSAITDIAPTLTGDMTLTQISPTSEVGVSFSTTLAGYNLMFDSSNPHNGDPTSGWLSTLASGAGLNMAVQGSAGVGNWEIKNLRFGRTTDSAQILFAATGGPNIAVHDLMIKCGTTTASGLEVRTTGGAGASTNLRVWNNTVYGSTVSGGTGISCFTDYSAPYTIENCTVYDVYTTGINLNTKAITARNNIVTDVVSGSDYTAITAATGYNNASEDSSAGDGNWATGSGNIVSVSAATVYVSTTESNPDFLKIKSGGGLENAGIMPVLTGNTRGIRGGPRPHAGLISIGADEFVTVNPGLKAKQIQVDPASFTGVLTLEDDNVELALARLDQTAGGISTLLNKNMVANATTSDGDLAADMPLQKTPRGAIEVRINGSGAQLGDGVKTRFCYFSGDGGTTARALIDIVKGDKLYWNGSVANFELDANDIIDFIYEA